MTEEENEKWVQAKLMSLVRLVLVIDKEAGGDGDCDACVMDAAIAAASDTMATVIAKRMQGK